MPDKLPFLPDEHHYAIAHVATRAAQLDHQIELSVDILMHSHKRGAEYIIKNSDTNRLVGLLSALLHDNFPSEGLEIEALMQEIRASRQERNEVLHWLWSKGEDETVARLASMRIHRQHDIKTKTAQEVYALARRLLNAVLTLQKFDLRVLKTAWPGKSEPPAPPPHSASSETPDRPGGGGLLGHRLGPSPEKSE